MRADDRRIPSHELHRSNTPVRQAGSENGLAPPWMGFHSRAAQSRRIESATTIDTRMAIGARSRYTAPMTSSATVLAAALDLTPEERADVAVHLLDSLDDDDDTGEDVAAAWEAEIARRVKDLREGRVKTIPASEVHARIEAKLKAFHARR